MLNACMHQDIKLENELSPRKDDDCASCVSSDSRRCTTISCVATSCKPACCKLNSVPCFVVAPQVRNLQPQGVQSWWQPGHPGWAIYPVDSDHFMSTGVLDSLSVQTESISTPPPSGSPGTEGRSLLTGSRCLA